jgi:hypothetical protein
VIDTSGGSETAEDPLIFKAVAGDARYSTGVSTRSEFARWARYEVYREEGNWRKLDE